MEVEKDDVLKLAEQRVEEAFSGHYSGLEKNSIVLAAIDDKDLWENILGINEQSNSDAISLAIQFLELTNIQSSPTTLNTQEHYRANWKLGVVSKSTLVALTAAAIGASIGIAGAELHPILVSIAGAEGAVILNILSSLLLDRKQRLAKVDGLDLAIIFALRKGQYSSHEIAKRISVNIDVDEIEFGIEKLIKQNIVKEGDWSDTYMLTSKGAKLQL